MLVDHLIMITIKFITCLQYNIYYNHRIMLLDYKYNPCLFLSLKFHSNEYIYIYIYNRSKNKRAYKYGLESHDLDSSK